MPPPPLATVDEVREELRRLGYLDHGVDRFVLGGARASSPLRASARAAARIGLLAGLLFGAASTAAAAALDPRLRAEPRDLVLLGAYLVIALGLAAGAAAFLAGLAAAWWGRRGARSPAPSLSRNIGLALGVLGLAYVALWWRSHAWGAGRAFQASALVLGLGLALALARFGSVAAVAVLSAGGLADRVPAASLSRRRLVPLLVAAALLFGGAVAAAAWIAGGESAEAPDFAVVPTGLRVRVVGIDGLEGRMAAQMMAAGAMPRLRALVASGAHGVLRPEPEQVPAIVWTTIATGRGPEAHGIHATGARRLPGMRTPVPLGEEGPLARALATAGDLLRLTRPQPATSVLRQAKTFWNVASDKGLRVGVVNWWATWPADAVNGYVVTERAVFKLEKGGPFDRETYPPSAFEALRALPRPDARHLPQDLDRFHAEAARRLRGATPADLEAVYLSGLDIATVQQLGDTGVADLAGLDARLDAVRAYYGYVDGLLGALAEGGGPSDVLVLVGDPGRLPRRGTNAEGLLVLSGTPIAAGDLGTVSERDVAPTVLHLAGLPLSRELEGRALESALTAEFRAAHPLRSVASYGRRPRGRATESAFDRQMLEELKSLGYVQ